MIVIKEDKPLKKKITPYYTLTYKYMIGDANGNTSETVKVSKDNPYLERYVKLLNSLKPTQGHWGIILEEYRIKKHFEQKQITEDDYNFLIYLMFEESDSTFVPDPKDEDYAYEFSDGVRGETEYSFLIFEGCYITYVDENNKKHATKIK